VGRSGREKKKKKLEETTAGGNQLMASSGLFGSVLAGAQKEGKKCGRAGRGGGGGGGPKSQNRDSAMVTFERESGGETSG